MSNILPETEVDDGFEDEEPAPNIVRIGKKPTMNYVVACVTRSYGESSWPVY